LTGFFLKNPGKRGEVNKKKTGEKNGVQKTGMKKVPRQKRGCGVNPRDQRSTKKRKGYK